MCETVESRTVFIGDGRREMLALVLMASSLTVRSASSFVGKSNVRLLGVNLELS